MDPPVPPRNTWVGAGSSCSASGALPEIMVTFRAANRRQFSAIKSQASGFRSMA